MGKKARKTRWRALAIDTGNQSDSEESHGATNGSSGDANGNKHYHNYHHNGGSHQHNGYQQHYGGVQRGYRAYAADGGRHPAAGHRRFAHQSHYASDDQHSYQRSHHRQQPPATRSSNSSVTNATTGNNGDAKITFNEDEYTRITTPRQDVLFKKGYLSKPKTYQTQTSAGASTISTGNSTGNGTPDHQSADGTEGTDMEYESQFVFPNGFVDQNGIYYINSYESYPLVVYNTPMCFPEYLPSTRSKRLSTGSLTESTSPHNEETSQELSHSGGETVNYPEYGNMYNVVYPGYIFGNGVVQEIELANGEPRKIKKRRRRKLSKPVPEDNWTTSSSDDYDESEEMVSEIENAIIQGTHRPPTVDTPPTPNQDEVVKLSEKEAVLSEKALTTSVAAAATVADSAVTLSNEPATEEPSKMALKPDAKEFIPRAFIHHHHHHHPHARHGPPFITNLIPLPPPFLHAPPAIHMPVMQVPPTAQSLTTEVTLTEAVQEPEIPPASTPIPPPANPSTQTQANVEVAKEVVAEPKNIDIAKIVTKLEEAAKEQTQRRVLKSQAPTGRGRRSYGRPLPVELNLEKKAAIRLEIKTASNTTTKNYAQMLTKKTNGSPNKSVRHSPLKEGSSHLMNAHGTNGTGVMLAAANGLQASPKGQQSQWIPVHSRKKRKNKNQEADWDEKEEVLEVVEEAEAVVKVNDDGFEAYDINKLEDVVVPRLVETITSKITEPEIISSSSLEEEIYDSSLMCKSQEANNEMLLIDNNKHVPDTEDVHTHSVVTPVTTETKEVVKQVSEEAKRSAKQAEEEEFDKLIRTLEELEAKTPLKKKALNKSNSKRVIITDTRIADAPKEIKPIKKAAKSEKVEKKPISKVISTEVPSKISTLISTEVIEDFTPPTPELSADDTDTVQEDVLIKESTPVPVLETQKSFDGDSPEKKNKKKKKKPSKKATPSVLDTPTSVPTTPTVITPEETSYNFLITESLLEEERTNVEVSEELDKIIQRGMFTSLEEKIKSLNITAVHDGFFQSIATLPAKRSKEDDLTSILTNTTNIFKAKRPLCQHQMQEPTTTGSFLDVTSLREDPGISGGVEDVGYPITRAVKDWMVRTRENTPEVELLKSPRTIFKEINKSVDGDGKDRITTWSLTPESSFDDDLLECWDDLEDTTKIIGDVGEESMEVYESLYGKNDDFKQIKAEVEEETKNGSLPKHGGLPFHAICCSVM